jgi:hypothetical protein
MKRFTAFLVAAGAALLARAAGAAESPSFWVEARPWTCSQHVGPVARELSLACDAAGGTCKVAASEASADRRIVLKCDDAKWTVETQDAKGARLWAFDVAGDPSDRARSAAVFAVRAETGESLPPAPRARETSPPIPLSVDAPHPPAPDTTKDAEPKRPANVSLAFSPRGLVTLGSATDDTSWGVSHNTGGLVGFALAATANIDGIHLGPTAAGALGIRRSVPNEQAIYWNGGVLAGIGAPFDRKTFGLSVDAGYGQRISDTDLRHYWYARPSVIAQLFASSEVRPFIAASYQVMAGGTSGHYVGGDLGVAWDLR